MTAPLTHMRRPQVFQCTKCGMFSHQMLSCRQPQCTTCSSKSHNTDDHPPNEKPKCINCKGEHPSNHKACNTRWIRLGLKPIPSSWEKPQPIRPKNKGKDQETTPEKLTSTEPKLDVGLMGNEISNIIKVGESHQTHKENTAKFIQLHVMDKLNCNPMPNKSQPTLDPADMKIIFKPLNQTTP